MPPLNKRTRTDTIDNDHHHHTKMSKYELSREERIRQNRERMGKLGIFDISLSLKLKPNTPSRRTTPNPKSPLSINPSGPSRRSSRLQNVAPVSYSEAPVTKGERVKNNRVVIREGSQPEVYTEEHEKLLGNTEKSWELFVDGVGKDGKRIYDSFQGKTCHQCRQKTLGYRTRCCECNMVQGQFCGDCLYMRYGEHVLEALADPAWKCPVCRGICNCSLCRQAKGWAPTGALYRRISRLGYKSVAHYLIQTRRADTNVEKNDDADDNESCEVNENKLGPVQHIAETDDDEVSTKRLLVFPDAQDQLEKVEGSDTEVKPLASSTKPASLIKSLPFSDADNNKSHEVNEDKLGTMQPLAETEGNEVAAKRSLVVLAEQGQRKKVKGSDTDVKRPASSTKPSPDSIAGRLRSRVKKT